MQFGYIKRISNELKQLNDNPYNIKKLDDKNLTANISDNKKEIIYLVEIIITDQYPFVAPYFKINTTHPNIHNNFLCYGLIKEKWNCAHTINSFLLVVSQIIFNNTENKCNHIR
jgi:ubiquitin-protein ligase